VSVLTNKHDDDDDDDATIGLPHSRALDRRPTRCCSDIVMR